MTFSRIPPSGNAVSPGRILSSNTADFRRLFSRHCGFPQQNILYAGSGTAALYIALLGLKKLHPQRTEVVLPAWGCPSVPQAILQAGLKPVLVDLDPVTFAYPPGELASSISESTLTVLLIHYFGIPQPRPELKNPPPFFIRDCAQDFDFRNSGEADTAVFYSFGRGKSLNCGHGGALCLPENPGLMRACQRVLESLPEPASSPLFKALLINVLSHPMLFGMLSSLPFLSLGKTVWEHPLRFTRIHPGFFGWAAACFDALEDNRDLYANMVASYALALAGNSRVALPFRDYGRDHLPVRFPLRVMNPALREKLRRTLNHKFGGVTGQYPEILSRLPGVPAEFPKEGFHPGAETIAREILTFPVTAWLEGKKQSAFLKECASIIG